MTRRAVALTIVALASVFMLFSLIGGDPAMPKCPAHVVAHERCYRP